MNPIRPFKYMDMHNNITSTPPAYITSKVKKTARDVFDGAKDATSSFVKVLHSISTTRGYMYISTTSPGKLLNV